jgi:outer membrane protein OmpA-like peptidoglycan-associated protein
VQLSSFDLGTLTPYTVTFIAYPLERGTLDAELDWKVAERRFDAHNRIRIDGLALGEKREAPRATSLPVKLGVALLTNSEGDADLDVPAYGDLDDPQFRYGKVILQAFTNLLSRAVTSPFAALGNLGGGDKPDLVPFAPGSAELAESETARLAGIATALADKPMLSLAITGLASGNGDREALRRRELELQLKREWLDSPFRRGKSPDEVTLDDEQRDDMLARLYRRAGGDEAALRDASGAALPPEGRRAAMEQPLLAGIVLQEGALRELARARAQQVKDRLLAAGVAEARLVIVEGTPAATDEPGARLALDAR